jgi:hypothetical protein
MGCQLDRLVAMKGNMPSSSFRTQMERLAL